MKKRRGAEQIVARRHQADVASGSLLVIGLAGLGFAGYRRCKRLQNDEMTVAEEGWEAGRSTP